MREIKFRAREIGMGYIVEGSLIERESNGGRKYYSIIDRYGNEYVANTKSIVQLCGYDAAGNEIYEGDKVNCYHGFYLPADELRKKEIVKVSKVRLKAEVDWYNENLNSPFDYQFLKK